MNNYISIISGDSSGECREGNTAPQSSKIFIFLRSVTKICCTLLKKILHPPMLDASGHHWAYSSRFNAC